ncbi:MAG TPA: BON domain-containing protein [Chthonomonadaceae bacterium]|nr:BON domain-containing protein [Chthonomonadaceae bacterium]
MKTLALLGATALLFGVGLVGCQNTAEGVKEDTAKNTQAVQTAADRAAEATKNAAQNVSAEAADATQTGKVKTAITSDSLLNDTRNRIDVDTAKGVVHLKGHVATNDMKRRATEVAEKTIKESGASYTVSNELTVDTH